MPQLSYVWEQRKDSRGLPFVLNKKHTLLNKLKLSLSGEQKELLTAYLSLVENFSPMFLSGVNDISINNKDKLTESDYESLVYQAKQLMSTLVNNGYPKEEIKEMFKQSPDFSYLTKVFDDIYMEVCNESK